MVSRIFSLAIFAAFLATPFSMAQAVETPVKFLERYPFKQLSPAVELVEGFSVYDGVLGDMPGAPHRGIDYVQKKGQQFVPFDVYSMHEGVAWRGIGTTWGNYVMIEKIASSRLRYYTIYAHLSDVPYTIPLRGRAGLPMVAGTFIGKANATGVLNGIPQLHLELQKRDMVTGLWTKLDPYGVYERASSKRYPQPGITLKGLPHFWFSDTPPFVK